MKKMNLTKLMAVLVVLCLITSTFVGSTLAKYVTSNGASDSARVAKWGVEIEVDGTMFGDAYKDTVATWTADEDVDTITVQASTEGTKVVAPGTKGALTGYTISGTPEVDVNVTYTADLTLTNWVAKENKEAEEAFYCPIVFTIGTVNDEDDATIISGLDYSTADALEKDVEDAITAAAAYYHTNTDLSAVGDDLSVAWAWAYEGNDYADTYLGNAATAANIALETSVTITQAD